MKLAAQVQTLRKADCFSFHTMISWERIRFFIFSLVKLLSGLSLFSALVKQLIKDNEN